MRLIPLLLASAFLLSAAGCGGGGSDGPQPPQAVVPQVAGEGTLAMGGAQVGGIDEHVLDEGRRTMLAFDVAPFAQPVAQATLRFVVSDNLTALALVELTVEHIDGGGILDPDDFDRAAFSMNGPLAQVSEHIQNVTMWVNLDIALGRPTSTFRISLTQIVASLSPIELTLGGSGHVDPTVRPTLTATP